MHDANVIEELVDVPRASAEDQIERARDVVEDKPTNELKDLTADLLEHPTIATASGEGAAQMLYGPSAEP
jgi:hypothetical protein